ncbi:MAG: H-type lectin domain-containing protein [Oscillospiraceae bacterium]|nr:H-type lectin domain-containing protein [Oscillospiraceae bacterium]
MKIKSAIGIRRTTVELTNDVTTVDFGHDYKYFAIRNDGSGSIYVSTANKECTAGEDEVVLVPSGSSYVHYNGYGGNTEIYLSGAGTATVVAQDDVNNPFKGAQGGGESVTVDVLNAALEEKADSKHSHTVEEISDFPTSMPASDVKDWAKANEKPTYTASEVGADVSGSADAALTNAKSYTDTKIADLINGAPTTLDTLGEIAEAMGNNQSVVEALNSAIGSKANASDLAAHTENASNPHNVTKSQIGLGNVPNVSTNDQTPSYTESTSLSKLSSGEKLSVAFGKISKAITDFISHIGDTVKHITSTERSNWNAAKSHADSVHAPSNAQSNVIETIKVNGTALTPSSKAVDITVPSYSTMTGATSSAAGTSGLVPAPASGEQGAYLRGDGTWDTPEFTGTLDDIPDGEVYYKSPYYIQAGQVTSASSGTASVTFPEIFGSTPFILLAYPTASALNYVPVVTSATASGFDIKKNTNYDTVNWIAFGKLPEQLLPSDPINPIN